MNTINLSLTTDTYVYSEFPNKNYYRGNVLKTGNTSSKDSKISRVFNTLIKFSYEEISGLATIDEAKIYLYVKKTYSKQNKPFYLSISKNTADFIPSKVTASTIPNTIITDNITTLISKDNEGKYIEIDIGRFVQEWVDGISPNFGITISITSSKEYVDFSSSRSENPPHAVIKYTPKVIKVSEPAKNTKVQSSPPLLQVASVPNKKNSVVTAPTVLESNSKALGFIYNQSASHIFVHGGNDINLSNNGLLSNISHQEGTSSIKVNSSGTYSINYSISATSIISSEISLTVNGAIVPSSSKNIIQETGDVYGTLLLELNSGDILTFRNTSATVLQLSPNVNLNCTIMQHV